MSKKKLISLNVSCAKRAIKNPILYLLALIACSAHYSTLKAQCVEVDITYLYWNTTQTNMSYGIAVDSNTLSDISDLSPIQQETEWSSGFRLGAAYYLPCSWGAHFDWTHFHNNVSGSFSSNIVIANQLLAPNINNTIIGGDGVGGPATSNWGLQFDMFDLNFGFSPYDNCAFCFYPFFGIKGGKINQDQYIQYINFTDGADTVNATVNLTNHFWGVGPKFGLNGSYIIGCGFNLVGMFSVGTLFGDHHSNNDTELTIAGVPASNKFNFLKCKSVPEIELFVGVNWRSTFCNCYLVSLAVGYESQYFWNTWRTQNSTIQNLYVTNAGFGDLMLQGVTARLGVGF